MKKLGNFGLRLLRIALETGSSISSNLAASAIDRSDAMSATFMTGLAAACLAGKTAANGRPQDASGKAPQAALSDLQEQIGNLQRVVERLASGELVDPHFPIRRAQAFLTLIRTDVARIEDLSEQQNAILFEMIRWLEAWRQEHEEEFAQLQATFSEEGQLTRVKLDTLAEMQQAADIQNRSDHADTHAKLDRVATHLLNPGGPIVGPALPPEQEQVRDFFLTRFSRLAQESPVGLPMWLRGDCMKVFIACVQRAGLTRLTTRQIVLALLELEGGMTAEAVGHLGGDVAAITKSLIESIGNTPGQLEGLAPSLSVQEIVQGIDDFCAAHGSHLVDDGTILQVALTRVCASTTVTELLGDLRCSREQLLQAIEQVRDRRLSTPPRQS